MKKIAAFILFLLALSSCNTAIKRANQTAEELIWNHPDSTIICLQMTSTCCAQEEDLHVRQLLLQAAWMRLTHAPSPCNWDSLLSFFEETDNRLRKAQCLYYKGVSCSLNHDADEAQRLFLQAADYDDVLSPHYLGMSYYRLGVISEENGCYDTAFSYYSSSLPFLLLTDDKMLVSCCYRDMARMSYTLGDDSTTTFCFSQAMQYAESVHDPILTLDIAIQETGNSVSVDSARLLRLYQTLGREGRLLHYEGKEYEMGLLEEHLEREKSLQVQHRWGLGLLLALVMCACLLGVLLYIRGQREHFRQRLAVMEQDKLLQNIDNKRALLLSRLHERLLMQEQTINWEAFYDEFDAAYDGLLSRLKSVYPELTEMDIRYIALTYMDFKTSDICLLLNYSKRTIYNRRQILKQHLGIALDDLDDLDSWIKGFK